MTFTARRPRTPISAGIAFTLSAWNEFFLRALAFIQSSEKKTGAGHPVARRQPAFACRPGGNYRGACALMAGALLGSIPVRQLLYQTNCRLVMTFEPDRGGEGIEPVRRDDEPRRKAGPPEMLRP